MSTIRKIEANRLNAQHSTGPKTDEGKAISCLNNLKHGLRATTVVLPEENQEDFDLEYDSLLDHCQPEGPVEHHLVDQMAVNWWKAVRVGVLIQRHVDVVREDAKTPWCKPAVPVPSPAQVMAALASASPRDTLDRLDAMEQRYDRAYLRAERRLTQIQKERRQQQQLQPPAALPAPASEPEPVPVPEPAAAPDLPQPLTAEPVAAEPQRKPPAAAPTPGPSDAPLVPISPKAG